MNIWEITWDRTERLEGADRRRWTDRARSVLLGELSSPSLPADLQLWAEGCHYAIQEFVSPSSLKRLLKCGNQWALHYLSGVKEPEPGPSDPRSLGKRIHALLERRAKEEGFRFDNSAEGLRALELWLQVVKGEGVRAEQRFFGRCGGFLLQGVLDFLWVSPDGETAIVGDYKTTSNPRNILTAEALALDPAVSIYGALAREHFPNLTNIYFAWLYSLPNRSVVVRCTSWSDVEKDASKALERITPQLELIQALRAGKATPEKNFQACGGIGRYCYQASTCFGESAQ